MDPTTLTRSSLRDLSAGLHAATCRVFCSLVLIGAAFLTAPRTASAAPVTVPPGLAPGVQYRLAFVTSTTRDKTSSNIAVYDTFVTDAANTVDALAALGTSWKAIGSTSAITARDNTGTNVGFDLVGLPIYNLAGELVAATNSELWDSSITNAIQYTEDGSSATSGAVWTGSSPQGGFASTLGLPNHVDFGLLQASDVFWIQVSGVEAPAVARLYGMSGALTVPLPEPSTLVLACFAAAALAVPMLRRRRNGRP